MMISVHLHLALMITTLFGSILPIQVEHLSMLFTFKNTRFAHLKTSGIVNFNKKDKQVRTWKILF